jgi:hypothetical protein
LSMLTPFFILADQGLFTPNDYRLSYLLPSESGMTLTFGWQTCGYEIYLPSTCNRSLVPCDTTHTLRQTTLRPPAVTVILVPDNSHNYKIAARSFGAL